MIKRRTLLRTVLAGIALSPFHLFAQVKNRLPRVGAIFSSSNEAAGHLVQALLDGLRELGYVDGRNMVLEVRYAEGKVERFVEFADDMVQRKFDIIVAPTSAAAIAVKKATSTTHIPVVTVLANDPVGEGLVASLAHPGGNVTGMANINADLGAKRLGLLKETFPNMSRLAVIYYAVQPGVVTQLKEVDRVAKELRWQLLAVELNDSKSLRRLSRRLATGTHTPCW